MATSPRDWRCSRPCRILLSVLQQELDLQIALGPSLDATKGQAAPEVGHAYTRARELCQQVGETSSSSRCCVGSASFSSCAGGVTDCARAGEELLTLAQRIQDPAVLLEAWTFRWGVPGSAWEICPCPRRTWEQGIALYDPQQQHPILSSSDGTWAVFCRAWAPHALWHLGYPDQALP